jgi:hypothetical protein
VTVYSYAQLEGLWINAGGPKAMAPLMAAIAEAESGGNSDAYNASGASGLWQILGAPQGVTGNAFDPSTNARMAVAKWQQQGLGAWVTYTDGAYKPYLQNSTTPDTNVPGSPTATPTQTAIQLTATETASCAFGFSHNFSLPIPLIGSLLPSVPIDICFIHKSEVRAIYGGALIGAGAIVMIVGVAFLGVFAMPKALTQIVVQPVLSAVNMPRPKGGGGARGGSGPDELDAMKKQLGEPRENPALEVGGGTVRESDAQRAARRRREQSRSTAASISPGGTPATRQQAGF